MKKNLGLCFSVFWVFQVLSQGIIIDKPPFRDHPDATSIISTQGIDGVGIYSADSFIITETVALGQLDVWGVNHNMPLEDVLSSINVYIFEDKNGIPFGNPDLPGTAIVELPNITEEFFTPERLESPIYNFKSIQLTAVNGGEQIILEPGKYWLSFFPTIDAPGPASTWLWTESLYINEDGTKPMLIDPSNYFGEWPIWTEMEEAIDIDNVSFAFQFREYDPLSVENFNNNAFSVYPNPGTNILYIQNLKEESVAFVKIFDMTGKQVSYQMDNSPLNTIMFASGLYQIHIISEGGNTTMLKWMKN